MVQIPKGVPSPLSVATFDGAPLGMARNAPQHEIADTQAWTLVDANLNDPGFIHRRGPLAELSGSGKASRKAIGMARVQDPAGVEQILVLAGGGASEVYGIEHTNSITGTAWPYTFSTAPYELVDSKDALNAGVLIGTAPSYDNPAHIGLAYWRGASKPDASSLACAAYAIGATTISMSDASSVSPGHFVFNNNAHYVGVVKSISGNVLTLEEPALTDGTSTLSVQVLRGINPRVATGRITCSTDSTEVNGGLTKFSAQGLATGTWDIYTTDKTFIGTVATVNSDVQLDLAANANVSLAAESYLAIRRDGSFATDNGTLGFLNASYGGHQFYAKGNVLYFSESIDLEAVDMTVDGNSIIFSADPIRALIPTLNGLVVCTEQETFVLQGPIGTTPDQWRGVRIHDDGTLCGMSAETYKGGALWAGRRGLWFWDGSSPQDIAGALDGTYAVFAAGFSSSTDRAYGAIVKDHYLCFMEGGASGIFQRIEGATSTDITRPTFTVNLGTGALAILENVELRGCVIPPESMAVGEALLPITTNESGTTHVRVIDGGALFNDQGQDPWACDGGPGLGPHLYVDAKRYPMGDPQRLKLFRQMQLTYASIGGNLKVDWCPGLNPEGIVSPSQFLNSTEFQTKRLKLNRGEREMGFRLYESDISGDPTAPSPPAANITSITLGSWALGFKLKRPGRV